MKADKSSVMRKLKIETDTPNPKLEEALALLEKMLQ